MYRNAWEIAASPKAMKDGVCPVRDCRECPSEKNKQERDEIESVVDLSVQM